MTRLSPAVTRTVAVLNFLGEHPEQAFTLTEIVKSLRLSRATCHALLAALVEAGYLYRASDKTYMLGPALAAIGMRALKASSPLQAARPEMRALADEFDAICTAYFSEGDNVVIRERAASMSHLGWTLPQSLRSPLVPPLGALFVAWTKDEEIERWLGRASPAIDDTERDYVLRSLDFIRQRGFAFGYRTVQVENETHAQSLMWSAQTRYQAWEIDPDQRYDLAYVTVPVFGAKGQVAFGLALGGFVQAASGAEIVAIAARMQESARRIERFLTGQPERPVLPSDA